MTKRSIEEILAAAKKPVRAVQVCLDADLQGEHDELVARLEVLRRDPPTKMDGQSEVRQVADQIRELEARMHEAEVTFKLRGLAKPELRAIQERFPPPDPNPRGLIWNVDEGAHALLAASALEPTMTEAQARSLLDTLSEGHADRLVGAAWLASTGSTQVPFSARASDMTSGTGSN